MITARPRQLTHSTPSFSTSAFSAPLEGHHSSVLRDAVWAFDVMCWEWKHWWQVGTGNKYNHQSTMVGTGNWRGM